MSGQTFPPVSYTHLVALIVFIKKEKVHHYGKIIAGLGILFIGMDMMSSAMMPLRDSQTFINLMTKFSNPVLGILAGALFTAVTQSSSASVGKMCIRDRVKVDGEEYTILRQSDILAIVE